MVAIVTCYVQDDAEQRADIRVFWVLVLVFSRRITPTYSSTLDTLVVNIID